MNYFDVFLIAVGLSMDAFAVSIVKGLQMKKIEKLYTFLIGICFGCFQALMPLLGYTLSSHNFKMLDKYSHIIVLIILSGIGANMIRESFHEEEEVSAANKIIELLFLGVATSIDALAVGISFGIMPDFKLSLIISIILIGLTTFSLSIVGVAIGKFFGSKYKKHSQILGGIILIIIGLKVFIGHFL